MNGAVATARDSPPVVSSTNACGGREAVRHRDERLRRAPRPGRYSIARSPLTTASVVGTGSTKADCDRAPSRFAPNADRSAVVPGRVLAARGESPSPAASITAASIGTYGGRQDLGGRTIRDRLTALNDERHPAVVPPEPLPGLGGLRARSRARSGNPRVRARRFAILSSRPPGFSWATTFGSSDPSGSVIGSAIAWQDERDRELLVDGLVERVSTATSHVTNDPDATPVFTSSTFTG